MNQFSAQKLGEVIAFCRVGDDTLERGQEALEGIFGSTVDEMRQAHARHQTELTRIATTYEAEQTALEKADRTQQKLEKMRDLYLADDDDWRDPAELMEWSGFFEGAFIVHLRVIEGVADKRSIDDLASVVAEALSFHQETLNRIGAAITEITADRISA